MKVKITLLFFIIISIITPAQTIQSTITELSQNADIIFTGKVINKKSDWNKDRTRIFTRITINVDEYLKGNGGGNSFSLIQPGGEVGEIGEFYTHVPAFDNNEEVLLFIKESSNYGYQVLDGDAGKISLLRDGTTGEKITPERKKFSVLKDQIKNSIR